MFVSGFSWFCVDPETAGAGHLDRREDPENLIRPPTVSSIHTSSYETQSYAAGIFGAITNNTLYEPKLYIFFYVKNH